MLYRSLWMSEMSANMCKVPLIFCEVMKHHETLWYTLKCSEMLWYSSYFFRPHQILPLAISYHWTHVVHLPHIPTTPVEHARHRGTWQHTFSDETTHFQTFLWFIETIGQAPLIYYGVACFTWYHFSFTSWFDTFFTTSCLSHVGLMA
jgi:hypothetical protein